MRKKLIGGVTTACLWNSTDKGKSSNSISSKGSTPPPPPGGGGSVATDPVVNKTTTQSKSSPDVPILPRSPKFIPQHPSPISPAAVVSTTTSNSSTTKSPSFVKTTSSISSPAAVVSTTTSNPSTTQSLPFVNTNASQPIVNNSTYKFSKIPGVAITKNSIPSIAGNSNTTTSPVIAVNTHIPTTLENINNVFTTPSGDAVNNTSTSHSTASQVSITSDTTVTSNSTAKSEQIFSKSPLEITKINKEEVQLDNKSVINEDNQNILNQRKQQKRSLTIK